ncbi:MAG: hypothetical protein ACI81O_000892 [Cyclobacteriaceae bacterium]|jgi:hypothetical protein
MQVIVLPRLCLLASQALDPLRRALRLELATYVAAVDDDS